MVPITKVVIINSKKAIIIFRRLIYEAGRNYLEVEDDDVRHLTNVKRLLKRVGICRVVSVLVLVTRCKLKPSKMEPPLFVTAFNDLFTVIPK